MEHNEYPHIRGYLYGCEACETSCHCDVDEVLSGRAAECIYCEDMDSE